MDGRDGVDGSRLGGGVDGEEMRERSGGGFGGRRWEELGFVVGEEGIGGQSHVRRLFVCSAVREKTDLWRENG